MINIDLILKCKKCNGLASLSIDRVHIDNKTSEEEFLIKEYICSECNYRFIEKEYINYIIDKEKLGFI